MSADQVAAAMLGAGFAVLVMSALMVIVVMHVYQGAHAGHEYAQRDGARHRQYHRLSVDERRIWRSSGEHPVLEERARAGEGAARDAAGVWRPAHA